MALDLPLKQPESNNNEVDLIHPTEIMKARAENAITESEANRLFREYVTNCIPPAKVGQLLKDLMEASDTRYTKKGDLYTTPNWQTRMGAYDRAMKALKIWEQDKAKAPTNHPTTVIFNVVHTKK